MKTISPNKCSRKTARWQAGLFLLACSTCPAQVSQSAYRVLGQADLRQAGVNMVQGVELFAPAGIALDARGGQVHIYISDTLNARVLAWSDVSAYQIGDPPSLVLGQPGPQYSTPLGIGPKGFTSPGGLAVDQTNGNLYVADTGDNRVVRFPSPFANPNRIEPDLVYGQPDFNTRIVSPVSATSLNQPRAVAFDSGGNLWVADTGNHRIVRFSSGVLNSSIPPAADVAVGQKDRFSGTANAGAPVSASGLDTPLGLAFDSQDNLYVSDSNNSRVLRFTGPLGTTNPNPAATIVLGQANFASRGVPSQPSASTIPAPAGLAVDGSGNLYIADQRYNRVLVFGPVFGLGSAAKNVFGQSDFASASANPGAVPLASPNTLSAPQDVKVDQSGNLFVADSGNNRAVEYPVGSKSANRVWGQSDFTANGANQIKPGSLNLPFQMAIDYSAAPYALYVSDTSNNRVLGWRDSVRFRNGDAADFVIGQPSLRTAAANIDTQGGSAPSATSLSAPAGIVVAANGTLYLADSGNHRVLRYPRPANQSGRITPDAVLGQADFTSSTSAAVGAASLNRPGGLSLGPNGNLFVADRGNNRVLEFTAGAGTGALAIRVYGQPNMSSSVKPSQVSAQTLSAPQSVAVDAAANLYVADNGSNRVVIIPNTQSAPAAGAAAAFVIGQAGFSGSVAASGAGGLRGPADVGVDSTGNIFVSDGGNNRVMIYPSLVFLPVAGGAASGVVGQQTTAGSAVNYNSTDGLATAEGLSGPVGVYIDRQDTLYAGDAGNNRVVQFLKPAAVVNAASFQASSPVGQGSIATLFSSAVSTTTGAVNDTTWPTVFLNRQIVINDSLPAPLYSVTPQQISFQMPSNAPIGTDRIAVRTADTGELIAGGSILVAGAAPGLFTAAQNGTGQAAALNQDNTVNTTSNPVGKGTVIQLYGTGQGQVSPSVQDGTAAPFPPGLANTVAVPTSDQTTCLKNQPSMCVTFGTLFGDVQYSGLAPGYIGLWQVNVKVPAAAPTGAVQVRILVNGTASNIVTIAVR